MKNLALIIITLLSVVGVFLLPAIPQPQSYHQFADQQSLFGLPNYFNTLSNIPYLIIGYFGYRLINSDKKIALANSIRYVYQLFFIGVFFIGIGSFYYHLSPDNSTLLWDRLPMAITFMSFFTIIIAEFINEKLAKNLCLPLLLIGTGSVVYWYWTESIAQGDLRLYVLVQFLPVLLMPIIFTLYATQFTMRFFFWLILIIYVIAKGLEVMDYEMYEMTGAVSGHTLKHLVSVVAAFMFYLALKKRSRTNLKKSD